MSVACTWMVAVDMGRAGEMSGYFLQGEEVGLTESLEEEGIKERGIKGDSHGFDFSNWVGVL